MAPKKRNLIKDLKHFLTYHVGCHIVGILLKLNRMSLRYKKHNAQYSEQAMREQGKIIYVFWHQDLISVGMFGYQEHIKHRPVYCMISRSRDGDLLTRLVNWQGVKAVRGSSSDGAAQALKEMISILNHRGNAAIALDGPRGPRQEIKKGIFLLAKKTGAAIIPISWEYHNAWTFRSWDRTRLAKPFSRIEEKFHGPFLVPADAGNEIYKKLTEEIRQCLGNDQAAFQKNNLKQSGFFS